MTFWLKRFMTITTRICSSLKKLASSVTKNGLLWDEGTSQGQWDV
jgi:hypothetical protein